MGGDVFCSVVPELFSLPSTCLSVNRADILARTSSWIFRPSHLAVSRALANCLLQNT